MQEPLITIGCICGVAYDVPRFHKYKCSSCGRIYLMRPDDPRNYPPDVPPIIGVVNMAVRRCLPLAAAPPQSVPEASAV